MVLPPTCPRLGSGEICNPKPPESIDKNKQAKYEVNKKSLVSRAKGLGSWGSSPSAPQPAGGLTDLPQSNKPPAQLGQPALLTVATAVKPSVSLFSTQ